MYGEMEEKLHTFLTSVKMTVGDEGNLTPIIKVN
jgi:hypothetical protein